MNTALIAIDIIARMNQMSVDTRAIAKEYGFIHEELSEEELLRVLKQIGFKAKLKTIPIEQTMKYPLPAIFRLKNGTYGILLKVNYEQRRVLLFTPDAKETKEKTYEEFEIIWDGDLIILSPKLFSDQVKFGFLWFYAEILKHKRVIGEVLLGSFVVQLFGLVTPLFTQVILDKVIVHHSMTTLDVLAVAFVAVMVFEFLLNISRNYIFAHTANKIDAKLGAKLFKHLFSLPFVYFESRKVGNIVARVKELDTIREFITNKSVSVIIDSIFSVVFLVMMLLYSVPLTLMVLGFVAVIAFIYVTLTPIFRDRLETKFQMGAQSNSYLVESITGMQTVKSLAIEGAMQRKWEDYLGKYLKSSFSLATMGNIAQSLCNLLQRGMTIAVLFFGVKMVIENKLTVGQLIAFQMFTGQLTGPILRLANLWNEFQQTLLAVDRLGDILNHPEELQSAQAITLPAVKGAIRIENISFRYVPDSPYVINRINFEVPSGTSIGIVGRSGSGKSTVTKLLQRLYLPQEGAIYIDNVDVRHMNPSWLRNQIGVVLQENYLFSGTIRENISLPKPDASMDLILQMATLAGAHDFISQLPEGYDTMVGERGSTLSGGQKQRIAIARALITNPRILILDEATSALDYESERVILENLDQIKQGRTLIVIAHRLSTVQNCDRIIAMDHGQIVESGNHQELLNQKGYYHDLCKQQERTHVLQNV